MSSIACWYWYWLISTAKIFVCYQKWKYSISTLLVHPSIRHCVKPIGKEIQILLDQNIHWANPQSEGLCGHLKFHFCTFTFSWHMWLFCGWYVLTIGSWQTKEQISVWTLKMIIFYIFCSQTGVNTKRTAVFSEKAVAPLRTRSKY